MVETYTTTTPDGGGWTPFTCGDIRSNVNDFRNNHHHYQQHQQQQQQQQQQYSPKQSLSALRYSNNNFIERRTNHVVSPPQIPEDGFQSSSSSHHAFHTPTSTRDVAWNTRNRNSHDNYSYHSNNNNKASEQASSHHQRNDTPEIRSGVFIGRRPTISNHSNLYSGNGTRTTTSNSRYIHRPSTTRNTDVSELFLAEAKAAQAKLDLDMQTTAATTTTTTTTTAAAGVIAGSAVIDGNGSICSGNTFEATIDNNNRSRPRGHHSRQKSLSSIDAVGPNDDDPQQQRRPLITLQLVDDTVQIATNTFHARRQQQQQCDVDDQYLVDEQPQHHRSNRQPLGLAYTLRKTDSGSTFQSLDGLSNTVTPFVLNHNRHGNESSSPSSSSSSKMKKKHRKANSKNSKRKKRSSSSTASSTTHDSAFSSSTTQFTTTANSTNSNTSLSFLKCHPTMYAFDDNNQNNSRHNNNNNNNSNSTNRFACFLSTPSCLPMDQITESFDHYRHRYYASTAYNNQRKNSDDIDNYSNNANTISPSKQREGPERSPSPTPTSRANVQQQHLSHIRDRRLMTWWNATTDTTPEISTQTKGTKQQLISPTVIKTVRFATPLVTKITYRPYTPRSEIALLFFQEEELEELECDRETVMGDQFECQYDERAFAVRIAYQQINPTDE